VEHVHDHGIVYRDLKPSNCGFDTHGNVKLFDFGLARTVLSSHSYHVFRRSGNAGTARYMSPETFAGHGEALNFPSDVHSLGILLWEICTLKRPYDEYSSVEQLSDSTVHDQKRPCLRYVADKRLRQVLAKCWDPNPSCRPTASETLSLLSTTLLDDSGK
jgi:serine/threonine protein kinase